MSGDRGFSFKIQSFFVNFCIQMYVYILDMYVVEFILNKLLFD